MNDHKERDQSLGINKCEESLLKATQKGMIL